MARSLWKGPFCESFAKRHHVWSRRSTILPEHVNTTVWIHNGKSFLTVKISGEMVGHKFGEFAITRRKPLHKKKK